MKKRARRSKDKYITWEDFREECLAASADGESRATGLTLLEVLVAVATVVAGVLFSKGFHNESSGPSGIDPAWVFWAILLFGFSAGSILGGLGSMLRVSAKRLRLEVFDLDVQRAGRTPESSASTATRSASGSAGTLLRPPSAEGPTDA